jgi:hypothetical protein
MYAISQALLSSIPESMAVLFSGVGLVGAVTLTRWVLRRRNDHERAEQV